MMSEDVQKSELNVFIFLPLPVEVSKIITEIQNSLGFYLEINGPHVTVYHCKFTESLFDKLIAQLSQHQFNRVTLTLDEVEVQENKEKGAFCSIKVNSKELRNFHEAILNFTNPLRGDLQRGKEEERIRSGKYSSADLEYVLKYGYIRVIDKYDPHITIGDGVMLRPEQLKEIEEKIKSLPTDIVPDHFVVQLQRYDGKYAIVREERINFN